MKDRGDLAISIIEKRIEEMTEMAKESYGTMIAREELESILQKIKTTILVMTDY